MCLPALNGWTQEDTLRIVRNSQQTERKIQDETFSIPTEVPVNDYAKISRPNSNPSNLSKPTLFRHPSLFLPYYINPSPMFKGDFHTSGILFSHQHGAWIGTGSQTSLPGIGRSNDVSFTYIHSFNPQWTLSVGLDANKMHMSHFTGQSFGASGTLSYLASERITFNIFGGYDSGYVPGRQSYHFGGTIDIEMTERFGMEMGVQRYYNPLRGSWETIPIAVPHFKFNNGSQFGIDVGGWLYDMFRDNSFKREMKKGHFSNPTIAPPRPVIEIR